MTLSRTRLFFMITAAMLLVSVFLPWEQLPDYSKTTGFDSNVMKGMDTYFQHLNAGVYFSGWMVCFLALIQFLTCILGNIAETFKKHDLLLLLASNILLLVLPFAINTVRQVILDHKDAIGNPPGLGFYTCLILGVLNFLAVLVLLHPGRLDRKVLPDESAKGE